MEAIYDEAKKLGLDAGDLSDYGFDKRPQCGDKKCFNPDKFKKYDEFLNKTEMLGEKIAKSGSAAYKKAMCSPFFKEKVHPKVEFIWAMFPFDCCLGFGPVSLLLNGTFLPFTWCCIIPIYQWIIIPWNIFFTIGLGPLLLLFVIPCTGGSSLLAAIYNNFTVLI